MIIKQPVGGGSLGCHFSLTSCQSPESFDIFGVIKDMDKNILNLKNYKETLINNDEFLLHHTISESDESYIEECSFMKKSSTQELIASLPSPSMR